MTRAPVKPSRKTGDSTFYRTSDLAPLVRERNPDALPEFYALARQHHGRPTRESAERIWDLTGEGAWRARKIARSQLRGYSRVGRFADATQNVNRRAAYAKAVKAWEDAPYGRKDQAVRDVIWHCIATIMRAPS